MLDRRAANDTLRCGRSDDLKGMTVAEMVDALLRVCDPDAIPEFTLDGDLWFRVSTIVRQADGNVTLEVEPW